MPQACWIANARSEYWTDVSLGGTPFQVLVDTGLVDSRGQVGFSIDESDFDNIKQSGRFQNHQMFARLSADGNISLTESGSLDAQLICPQSRNPVGPIVHVYVLRGAAGVPNRVGSAFFHHLKGCKIVWDLDQRSWCVDYP